MLDLKSLEARLDDALAKETKESLSSWLICNRRNNLQKFFNDGLIYDLETISSTSVVSSPISLLEAEDPFTVIDESYSLAA